MKIILLTNKSYHKKHVGLIDSTLCSEVKIVQQTQDISKEMLQAYQPSYIFVLHWSEYISEEVFNSYETIVFHMTPLPYGRGGSPLQNLILRGFKSSMLTAFKCSHEIDAGGIYNKTPISLEGNAQEILNRNSLKMMEMINFIIKNKPTPSPQVGEVIMFNRRKPNDSDVEGVKGIENFYDHIRMLDGEGYPPAFLKIKKFHIEFTQAILHKKEIYAQVKIKEENNENAE